MPGPAFVSASTARRHARGRARGWQVSLAGFAAAATVVLAVVGLIALRADDDGGPSIAGPGVATAPTDATSGPEREPLPNFVAVKEDGRVVVITNADGRERQIADGADDLTTLAVTPDGEGVYFSRPGSEASECGPNREIAFAPTDGGEVRVIVTDAADPAVSPNGKRLAYAAYAGSDGCANPTALVVRRIKAGPKVAAGETWTVGTEDESVFAPSWAPDSRHVTFALRRDDGITTYEVLDVNNADSLSDGDLIALPPRVHSYGYFGESHHLLGTDFTGPSNVVVLDSETGDILRVLFQIDSAVVPLSAVASPFGQNVLVVAAPGQYTPRGTGLYVWQEVAPTPVAFTEGILAATFLPAEAER